MEARTNAPRTALRSSIVRTWDTGAEVVNQGILEMCWTVSPCEPLWIPSSKTRAKTICVHTVIYDLSFLWYCDLNFFFLSIITHIMRLKCYKLVGD